MAEPQDRRDIELPDLPRLTFAQLESEIARREKSADSEAYRDAIEEDRDACKSLHAFVQRAWHVLEPVAEFCDNWHIALICAHLEAITFGRFRRAGLRNRLLINVPPGTMKSLLVSVLWPAWEWSQGFTSLRYLTTSYSERYALRDARKMRDLVGSFWFQERWGNRVQLQYLGEKFFSNTATGSRTAVPFKSLTSGRGDRVLVDDPHSTETAESDKERERAIRIFTESLTNRLNSPKESAIVVIMQRLHEGDVSGVAIQRKLGYVHLMLPMRFEPDRACSTPFGRDPRTEPGELLFPQHMPAEVVDADEATMGSYAVAGQNQQRPEPRGGGLFKREDFGIVDAAPAGTIWCRGWDLAGTDEYEKGAAKAAYTVGIKLGRTPKGRYIIAGEARGRWSPAKVRARMRKTAEQDGRGVEIDFPQDPGQAGKGQKADYVANLDGFVVHSSPETGSKVGRALPFAAQVEAGNVDLLRGDWNQGYLDEVSSFPRGELKDRTDATSRAYMRLLKMAKQGGGASVTPPIVVT